VAGSCEYGDEPRGSGATEFVIKIANIGFSFKKIGLYILEEAINNYRPLSDG
jgi:hypothetical protein